MIWRIPVGVLVCVVLVWGANFNDAQNGDWNTDATWTEAGTPGTGDSVTISTYNITMSQGETCGDLVINGGNLAPGANTLTCEGNLVIANSSGRFTKGTSTVTLSGTGNLSNPYSGNALNILTQSGTITTTLTGDLRVGDLTAGAGCTIQADGSTRTIKITGTLTPSTVTWGGGVGQLIIITSAGSGWPGDDFGDVDLQFTGVVAKTLSGAVTTTGDIQVFRNGAGGTATLGSGGFAITCQDLKLGQTGDTDNGGTLNLTGNSALTVNGNLDIYADDGAQVNKLAVSASGTSAITVSGNWVVGSGGEFDAQSSTVTFDGAAAQTVTSGGQNFNSITITNSHASGVTFGDLMNSQGTLTFNSSGSAVRVDFDETSSHVWTTVAQSGANTVTLRSEVDANQWDVALTNAATLSNIDVKDGNLSGANITVSDGTSTDSGNNSANWVFTAVAGAAASSVLRCTAMWGRSFMSFSRRALRCRRR